MSANQTTPLINKNEDVKIDDESGGMTSLNLSVSNAEQADVSS